jgi:hypothetical protein
VCGFDSGMKRGLTCSDVWISVIFCLSTPPFLAFMPVLHFLFLYVKYNIEQLFIKKKKKLTLNKNCFDYAFFLVNVENWGLVVQHVEMWSANALILDD